MTETTPEVALPQLMTVKQVREALSLSGPTIYRLLESGQIPYVKIGRTRRVKREDVLAFIQRNTVARVGRDARPPSGVGHATYDEAAAALKE